MLFLQNYSLTFMYSKEFIYRFLYILVSFTCCICISLINIESIFFFETYPFLKFSTKKFIVTNTTDLFNTIWVLVISLSLTSVFPLVFYHLLSFSKSSWYNYQIYLFKILILFFWFFYILILFLCYNFILPYVIDFLIQWKLHDKYYMLNINIEFRILDYIFWILNFSSFFSIINCFFLIFIMKLKFLLTIWELYVYIKQYRKHFFFLVICVFFLISPSDVFLQFFTILLTFLFFEGFFLLLCYKIQKINIQ